MVKKLVLLLSIVSSTISFAQTSEEAISDIEYRRSTECSFASETFKKCLNQYCVNKKIYLCESEIESLRITLKMSYKTGSDSITREKVKRTKTLNL
jgi:hypothetical protein